MRSASSGGSSHARCSASAAQSPAHPTAGTSWSTCSSTATLRRSRSSNRRRPKPKPLLLARAMLRLLLSGTLPQHLLLAASTLRLLHKRVSAWYEFDEGCLAYLGPLGGIDWAAEPSGTNDWAGEPATGATGWDAQPSGWD